jgi:hypothetical protein
MSLAASLGLRSLPLGNAARSNMTCVTRFALTEVAD